MRETFIQKMATIYSNRKSSYVFHKNGDDTLKSASSCDIIKNRKRKIKNYCGVRAIYGNIVCDKLGFNGEMRFLCGVSPHTPPKELFRKSSFGIFKNF